MSAKKGPIIKPIETEKTLDQRPVLHGEYFPTHECNIGIISKKASGKTMCIANFLPKLVGRDTVVMLFVSTIHKDPVWKAIVKNLEDRGVPLMVETDIFDENGINLIKEFRNENSYDDDQDFTQDEPEIKQQIKPPAIKTNNTPNVGLETAKKPVKRKSKYKYSKYIIVLDDLGDRLHDSDLMELMKRNRHYRCTVILSTQYLNDIKSEGIRQLDYCMIFKNFSEDKVEELYAKLAPGISLDLFKKIYFYATDPSKGNGYEFLLFERAGKERYRQSFHTLLATHG